MEGSNVRISRILRAQNRRTVGIAQISFKRGISVKGAAGQAVQNMNLIFGLPEKEGLMMVPMFP